MNVRFGLLWELPGEDYQFERHSQRCEEVDMELQRYPSDSPHGHDHMKKVCVASAGTFQLWSDSGNFDGLKAFSSHDR